MGRAPLLVLFAAGCGGLSAHVGSSPDAADAVLTTVAGGDADADVDADADADSDADTDTLPPGTDPCEPPDLWDLGPRAPGGGSLNATYVGVKMDGVIEGSEVLDFKLDGVDASAWVVFTFYDDTPAPLCTVVFDASDAATPTADPPTPSGQTLFESWSLSFDANDGFTDCGEIGGNTDPRAWVASRSWTFSYGEMVDNTASLRDVIDNTAPGTWSTDWAPHVFASFVDVGGATALETGYVFAFPHTCYDFDTTSPADPRPTAGPLDAYVGNAVDLIIIALSVIP